MPFGFGFDADGLWQQKSHRADTMGLFELATEGRDLALHPAGAVGPAGRRVGAELGKPSLHARENRIGDRGLRVEAGFERAGRHGRSPVMADWLGILYANS